MPLRIIITEGTRADCTQADRLIEGLDADYLLADRGYDSNAIIEQARRQGIKAVIPQRKTAQHKGFTTKNSINYGILSKMLSSISRDGVGSPQDTPKTPHLSSPLYRSDASLSGQISHDYTI